MTEPAVFDDRACELGEGPLWHPLRAQFFWFDILGKRLLARRDDERAEWRFDEHVSAAGWIDADTLLIAGESGLWRLDLASGARERLVAIEADDPATRSNDGRVDPFGGFWIGFMGKRAEAGRGTIYRFHRGRLAAVVRGLAVPNALCFAPDGSRVHYADTPDGRIMTMTLDAEGWPAAEATVFADLREEGLRPDGAVIDAEGGLWNAQWGAGRVARYRPDGGFDRAIARGAAQTTCPSFGGEDYGSMLVTTARAGVAAPGSADGRTFLLDPGVRGRAEVAVRLAPA
ncbi:MAG: SMP-30/gluconolactonase/LRE family protein [Paracoccaceae bacterium]